MDTYNKAYQFRIYPNEEQRVLLAKTFGFSTKKEFGEGIGLYTIKQIAEQYKGKIEVVSADQQTSFTLTLPKMFSIIENDN